MGLIIKNVELETGIMSDKYIRIKEFHNIGEYNPNIINLNCEEYYNSNARANNKEPLIYNSHYGLNVSCLNATQEIQSLNALFYPVLKKHLQEKGFTVEDDMNVYSDSIEEIEQQIETTTPKSAKRAKNTSSSETVERL